MQRANCFIIALCWLMLATPVNAVIIFTDRTSWEAAVSGFTTETFDTTIADANSIVLANGIVSTVNLSLYTNGLNNVSSSSSGEYVGRVGVLGNFHPPSITWSLPGIADAFFGDFSNVNDGGLIVTGNFDGTGDITIDVSDYMTNTPGPLTYSGGFGILGQTAFSSFTWGTNDGSEFFNIDNFSTTLSTVPEPTTIALLSLGLFGLGFNRRKRLH